MLDKVEFFPRDTNTMNTQQQDLKGFGMGYLKAEFSTLASTTRTVESHRFYEASKRFMDIVVSASAIALLSPVFLAVAIAVRFSSPGPVLFRQKRLGRGNTHFWCYKYRTMLVDAENRLLTDEALRSRFDLNFKLKDDPRITKVGALLRKTSLDELPQLFNILEGSMSLVGPRPLVPRELPKYHIYGDRLLTVKPGLGGYWQAYRGSDTTYEERVQMDMTYIQSRGLLLDIKLIILTAMNVLKQRGAF